MKKKIFIVYVFIILLLILLPINSKESKINNTFVLTIRLDYYAHAFLFLPWMLLLPQKNIKIHPVIWVCIGIIFATFTEGLQFFIPYRAFNINDMVANSIGILLGALFLLPFIPFKKHFETINNR